MVYVAVVAGLLEEPFTTAIAFSFSVELSQSAPRYWVEEAVGVVPSVVY